MPGFELDISFDGVCAEDGSWMLEAMLSNSGGSTPKVLNARGNKLRDRGAVAFSQLLIRGAGAIVDANLGKNEIGNDGAAAIGAGLVSNESLQYLNLDGNCIGSRGMFSMAGALQTNASLTRLFIEGNCIRDEGAIALAQALKTNTSVRIINVNDNDIGPDGAGALGKTLEVNAVLKRLYIADNRIGNNGLRSLVLALRVNATLGHIALANNMYRGTFAKNPILAGEVSVDDIKVLEVPLDRSSTKDASADVPVMLMANGTNLGLYCKDASNAGALPTVVKVGTGTVAWKSQAIKVGHRIRSINGKQALGMTGSQVEQLLNQTKGKKLNIVFVK